jgi:hypothetical protein
MAYETVRARSLLAEGVRLARTLALRPRLAVAGFVAGGRAALGSLERSRFELDGRHGSRSKPAFAAGWLKAVSGR